MNFRIIQQKRTRRCFPTKQTFTWILSIRKTAEFIKKGTPHNLAREIGINPSNQQYGVLAWAAVLKDGMFGP